MAQFVAASDFDDRASTCEVQYDQVIDFNTCPPLTVIAPTTVLEDADVKLALKRWGIQKPIGYRMQRTTVQARTSVIFQMVGEYLEIQGYFSR